MASSDCVVLATSSFPWNLDRDFLRAFDIRSATDLPTRKDRLEFFKRKLPEDDGASRAELASKTEGYSVSDLQVMSTQAAVTAVKRSAAAGASQNLPVTTSDYLEALGSARPSVSRADLAWYYPYLELRCPQKQFRESDGFPPGQ